MEAKKLKNISDIIFKLCHAIGKTIPCYSDGDTYERYDIPLECHNTKFTSYYFNEICIFEHQIYYDNKLITLKIKKGLDIKGILNYSIEFKCKNEQINIDDDTIDLILKNIIGQLQDSLHNHAHKNAPSETINKLQKLCEKDITILLHGTDLSKVESILKDGLKIANLGLSCRTTVMIEKDVNKIITYDYAWIEPRPRNIIFAIPNSLFPNEQKISIGKRKMLKCEYCALKLANGYDGWCYNENYFYELIATLKNIGWVLPPEFIYGYLDYNGSLFLNECYQPSINEQNLTLRKYLSQRMINKL